MVSQGIPTLPLLLRIYKYYPLTLFPSNRNILGEISFTRLPKPICSNKGDRTAWLRSVIFVTAIPFLKLHIFCILLCSLAYQLSNDSVCM